MESHLLFHTNPNKSRNSRHYRIAYCVYRMSYVAWIPASAGMTVLNRFFDFAQNDNSISQGKV